jgi:hypothetical protein
MSTDNISVIISMGIGISGAKDLDCCFPSPSPIIIVDIIGDAVVFLYPLLVAIFQGGFGSGRTVLDVLDANKCLEVYS